MRASWKDGDQDKSVIAPISLIISAFAPVEDVTRTLTPQLRTDCGPTRLLLIDLGAGKQINTGNIKDPVVGFIFGAKGLMYNLTLEGTKISRIKKEQ